MTDHLCGTCGSSKTNAGTNRYTGRESWKCTKCHTCGMQKSSSGWNSNYVTTYKCTNKHSR